MVVVLVVVVVVAAVAVVAVVLAAVSLLLLMLLVLVLLLLCCQMIVTALSPSYYPMDCYDYCSIHVRCHYYVEGIKAEQLTVLTTVAVLSTAILS
jgi:hypothetical protein